MFDISKRFEERYGYLKKMGIKFEGLQMVDPIKKKHAIVLCRPFLFDCRLIPKRYDGIDIKVRIYGGLPEAFKAAHVNDHTFDPKKFECFVDKNLIELRVHFAKPEMTKDELLDALAFGNFEEHKKNFTRIAREKQKNKRIKV